MRSRILDPAFFKDEELSELPDQTRLFFLGLWCIADREGRLEERIKFFLKEVFPYSDVITCHDITLHLITLSEPHPFIIRYVADGKALIQIKNFKKYQRVHPHERRSVLPPPTDVITCNEMSGTSTSTSTSTSDTPYSPPSELGDGFELQAPARQEGAAKRAQLAKQQREWFSVFYGAYWRHVGKDAAEAAFNRKVRDEKTFDAVMAALAEQTESMLIRPKDKIPHPATWINAGRWKDEENVPMVPQEKSQYRPVSEILAQIRGGQ